MNTRMGIYLCFATVATWAAVAMGSGIVLQDSAVLWEAMAWQLAILILFVATTWPSAGQQSQAGRVFMWLLLPAIFLLTFRAKIDFFFIYTIIWVACAPSFFSLRQSWLMLVLINLMWYFIRLVVLEQNLPLVQTLLVATFHVFALLSAMTALASEQANEKTQKLNRELLATQHLLGEASREGERTRIARDLHDLLGHHLTALTINLQVLGHLTQGEAKEKTDQCYSLSKLLLSDVREAVSTLRDMPTVDLRTLLEITIREIPRLKISLIMEEELQLDDVTTSEVLLRCVQEAITNSLRHSSAAKAQITVSHHANTIELAYADDGGGCKNFSAGNGLKGMRERLEKLGGKLTITTEPNMRLQISAPLTS